MSLFSLSSSYNNPKETEPKNVNYQNIPTHIGNISEIPKPYDSYDYGNVVKNACIDTILEEFIKEDIDEFYKIKFEYDEAKNNVKNLVKITKTYFITQNINTFITSEDCKKKLNNIVIRYTKLDNTNFPEYTQALLNFLKDSYQQDVVQDTLTQFKEIYEKYHQNSIVTRKNSRKQSFKNETENLFNTCQIEVILQRLNESDLNKEIKQKFFIKVITLGQEYEKKKTFDNNKWIQESEEKHTSTNVKNLKKIFEKLGGSMKRTLSRSPLNLD